MDQQRGAAEGGTGREEHVRIPSLRDGLLIAVAVVVVGMALRAMGVILVPLIAAILVALAVMPVRDWVTAHVPRRLGWLGPLAALLLLLVMLSVFVGGLYLAARQLVTEIPVSADGIAEMLDTAGGDGDGDTNGGTLGEESIDRVTDAAQTGATRAIEEGAGTLGEAAAAGEDAEGGQAAPEGRAAEGAGGGRFSFGSVEEVLERFGDLALGAAGGVAAAALNTATATIAALAVVLFVTLLILFESGEWARKVKAITGRRAEWQLLESSDVIAGKVRSYFLVQGGIGLATALLYGTWLWIFGIDLLLVWMSITFLLTFIPVLGALVAGVLPVAYALLTRDFGTALLVGLGILAIEQVMGNFVEPRLQGRNIALSPLVVLVSLLFWGWVWGLAGALLAVPVTVALVVLGSHVPALRPWALLLTDQIDMDGLDEVTSRD